MAKKTPVKSASTTVERNGASTNPNGAPAREVLVADIIIKNAPDPVFVSDLEGKILQANDAVSAAARLPPGRGRRAVAVALHQRRGDARVHGRPARGRRARRDAKRPSSTRAAPRARSSRRRSTPRRCATPTGNVIGAIGILRDMRELDKARAYAESLIKNAPDPVFVSDLEGKILQANDAVSELLGFRRDEVRRAVALALHQRGGDARVHRRPARGRRAGRDPQRPPQPAQRVRRGHPDHAQRLGAARPGRQRDRRHRHPPRHARVRGRSCATSSSRRRSSRRRSSTSRSSRRSSSAAS